MADNNEQGKGLLRTSVVGSYSVPDWLGRAKTDFHRGRLSSGALREIEDTVAKAAIVDQLTAGIDIISDGEVHRDNDMDYVVRLLAGVDIASPKQDYFDYFDATIRSPLATDAFDTAGFVADFAAARALTDETLTFSIAGPFSLSRRIRNEAYANEATFVLALAEVLRPGLDALVAAGATHVQIDEPLLAGHPEAAALAIRAVNVMAEGLGAHVALHVCYGNRYARPAWEGHYDFLFPAVLDAHIDELVLEFARKGLADLELVRRYPNHFEIGVGVVDVKSTETEPVERIAARIRQALRLLPPDRLVVNPDCGLRHLPPAAARAKLQAMAQAAAEVRSEILGTRPTGAGGRRIAVHEQSGAAVSDTPHEFDVIGIGNAIVDLLAEVDAAVVADLALEPGSMSLVEEDAAVHLAEAVGATTGVAGGSGANTVVGISSFGGKTGYVAAVAKDEIGDLFVSSMRDVGVAYYGPEPITEGPTTGRCIVLVTPDGERTMSTYLGASVLIRPEHLSLETVAKAQVIYLEGYLADSVAGYELLREGVRLAKRAGVTVAVSLSDSFCVGRHREFFLELARAADVVFGNENEVKLLSGEDDLEKMITFVRGLGGITAITLGEKGSVIVTEDEAVSVPVDAVERVVDTTGAGDMYAAGFLYGYTHGADLYTCGRLGALASSEIISHIGARPLRSYRELLAETDLAVGPGGAAS